MTGTGALPYSVTVMHFNETSLTRACHLFASEHQINHSEPELGPPPNYKTMQLDIVPDSHPYTLKPQESGQREEVTITHCQDAQ